MHSISIPKNTDVIVSIIGANQDPALWGADSFEWKPERWLSPLPDAVVDAHIPGVYSHVWVDSSQLLFKPNDIYPTE